MSAIINRRLNNIKRETQTQITLLKWRIMESEKWLSNGNVVRANAYLNGKRDAEHITHCQHDLLEAHSTIVVMTPHKAYCKICDTTYKLK